MISFYFHENIFSYGPEKERFLSTSPHLSSFPEPQKTFGDQSEDIPWKSGNLEFYSLGFAAFRKQSGEVKVTSVG